MKVGVSNASWSSTENTNQEILLNKQINEQKTILTRILSTPDHKVISSLPVEILNYKGQ